jgi:2-hydroxychromene-2-carboxylate isomerase
MSERAAHEAPTLDFWFDYSCPYAYLGSTQVEALAARIGRALRYRPMLLGGVFKAVNTPQNLSETLGPAKAAHNAADMHRWAAFHSVKLQVPPGHPLRTVEALRATLATGVDPRVVHGFFRAYWVEGRAPSDPATIRDVLRAAGHDADAVLARLDSDALRTELRSRTDEAVALGIFGAPSYVLDGRELFWGQDRAALLEAVALHGGRGPDVASPPGVNLVPGSSARTLEIYWDFSSPFAYLGSTQAEALAKSTGAKLVWRPMLLGGLFRSIGQVDVPLFSWPAVRQRYVMADMERWATYWGVPWRFPARFPTNSIKALRAWLALPEERRDAFRAATFRAYWSEDRDIADDGVLRELIGADADAVLARCGTPEIKQALVDATQRAAAQGVFGAPTWVLDGRELFWGQDRIPLVERAILERI